jgi:hypothetical protein
MHLDQTVTTVIATAAGLATIAVGIFMWLALAVTGQFHGHPTGPTEAKVPSGVIKP